MWECGSGRESVFNQCRPALRSPAPESVTAVQKDQDDACCIFLPHVLSSTSLCCLSPLRAGLRTMCTVLWQLKMPSKPLIAVSSCSFFPQFEAGISYQKDLFHLILFYSGIFSRIFQEFTVFKFRIVGKLSKHYIKCHSLKSHTGGLCDFSSMHHVYLSQLCARFTLPTSSTSSWPKLPFFLDITILNILLCHTI